MRAPQADGVVVPKQICFTDLEAEEPPALKDQLGSDDDSYEGEETSEYARIVGNYASDGGTDHVHSLAFRSSVRLFVDTRWLGIFLLMQFGSFIVALYAAGSNTPEGAVWYPVDAPVASCRVVVVATSCIVSAFAWMTSTSYLASHLGERLFYLSQPVASALLLADGLLLALRGHQTLGIMFVLSAVVGSLWSVHVRERIQFAQVILAAAAGAMRNVPVLRRMAAFLLFVQTVYSCAFAVAVIDVLRSSTSRVGGSFCIAILFMAFVWTSRVIRAALSFVAAGTVATLLVDRRSAGVNSAEHQRSETGDLRATRSRSFTSSDSAEGSSELSDDHIFPSKMDDTLSSGRISVEAFATRAFTTSAGAICAGALFISVGEALSSCLQLVQLLESGAGWVCFHSGCGRQRQAPPECLSSAMERFVHGAHRYAWTLASLSGVPFHRAAKLTWQRFDSRSVEAVIEDDTTHKLAFFAATACGSLAVLIGYIWVPASSPTLLALFALGFSCMHLALGQLQAAVDAFFVVFAFEPDCLSETYPIIHHRLVRVAEMRRFNRT